MSTSPYTKDSQSPPGEASYSKKRRKGAARLSCAECRRQVYLTAATYLSIQFLWLLKVEAEVRSQYTMWQLLETRLQCYLSRWCGAVRLSAMDRIFMSMTVQDL